MCDKGRLLVSLVPRTEFKQSAAKVTTKFKSKEI